MGGCPLDIGDCPEKDLTKAINAVSYTHLDVYKRQELWWGLSQYSSLF